MTSKEALERIKKSHYIAMACMGIDKPDIETEKAINTIEKDLEALEIYEKFTIPNLRKLILKLYNNEELTREENEIIFDIMSLKNEVLQNERKGFKN